MQPYLYFYMGAGALNSGPHTHRASVLNYWDITPKSRLSLSRPIHWIKSLGLSIGACWARQQQCNWRQWVCLFHKYSTRVCVPAKNRLPFVSSFGRIHSMRMIYTLPSESYVDNYFVAFNFVPPRISVHKNSEPGPVNSCIIINVRWTFFLSHWTQSSITGPTPWDI